MSSIALRQRTPILSETLTRGGATGLLSCQGNDRWCVISVETEAQWHALATVPGAPGLAAQPTVQQFSFSKVHREELDTRNYRLDPGQRSFEVMDLLQRAGVPCGVVQTGKDLLLTGT